ncbi:MAG TPA: AmmeMemoRadiSam system radical SAM enzyme [Firmicutes bacterium]|nr:AmmeMemoRadiSam system radical SAM enzyme [Bacillota bacterium]
MSEPVEARFWERLGDNKVKCLLCPRSCVIQAGARGFCRGRENRGGTLISRSYGLVTSIALDPIEKKPLYHFYPGSTVLSVGTYGCNFSCEFCQNWSIAQRDAGGTYVPPQQLVQIALEQSREHRSCVGLAYTYSEPLVWYEYVMDTAKLARASGLCNVLVTNGYVSHDAVRSLIQVIDAANVDLKAFNPEYYKKLCHGELEGVLSTIQTLSQARVHVELTTLVLPGLNDSDEEMKALAGWIAALDPDIPLHLSRYFPANRMNLPPTPVSTLIRLREIARQFLRYVYVGNVNQPGLDDTYCPKCGFKVITRSGFSVVSSALKGRLCPRCGYEIFLTGEPIET